MERAIDGAAAGEERAIRDWLHHANAYLVMLRSHIQKEDHCLFPMVDRALDDDDRSTLAAEFEREEMGAEFKQRYERLADRLADLFAVEKTRTVATGAHHG
jgi:hemerythrin-like domain-containing protein